MALGLITIPEPGVEAPRLKKELTEREEALSGKKLAQRRAGQWRMGGAVEPEEIGNVIASIRSTLLGIRRCRFALTILDRRSAADAWFEAGIA